jgi:hypothetical protein
MKRLFGVICTTFLLLTLSISAHAGMWRLINQQFSPDATGGTWYCTYNLMGTTIQTTKAQKQNCEPQFND